MSDTIEKVKESPRLKISRFWTWCKTYETIRKFLSWGIIFLFLVLIAIMLFYSVEKCFEHLTGIDEKPELLKFIGWGISGLIATLVAVGLLQRTAALDEQNKITKEGQDKGHIHERFKAATDHLGNERASVRIAAFNEFYRLAELKQESGLKKTIFGILCAHLRQTTKDENYQKNKRAEVANLEKEQLIKGVDTKETIDIKPTEEVQSLLDILFKPNNEGDFIFWGMDANLEEVNLQGAKLNNANLQKANLQRAILQDANLQDANLQGANLEYANLQNAILQKANLQKTNLFNAYLPKAKLLGANLQKSDMRQAILDKADLKKVNLQGAVLNFTFLKNAYLPKANLQGVSLLHTVITKQTVMPDNWKKMVKKHEGGKIGVLVVDDRGNVIEKL